MNSLKIHSAFHVLVTYRGNNFKPYAIMDPIELGKAKAFNIVEIIEYIPNALVMKTIIKKTAGNVTAVSIDSGEALTEKIIPFDKFLQIIDGKAEVVIDGQSNFLGTGDSII